MGGNSYEPVMAITKGILVGPYVTCIPDVLDTSMFVELLYVGV